ncbi:uncharacterized protein DUF2272 [Hoeflea marina]|uniref:Uncharacterized protein DUF2272 n=1 Tax=Hoeflea marina TaxID=274592 RepID=A0A317PPI8_9HYPH|nr:DUF2272 domain-containing protein [Hoeflea marina]PWW03343.1 uncharacterized protein DUF2272 [Hoeflea marina]
MSFLHSLLAMANAEWNFFGNDIGRKDKILNGKNKEAVEPYSSRVADYWLSIGASEYKKLVSKYAKSKGRLDGTTKLAWSAAFVSYCMQQAGAGNKFPYSSGHATWIVQSINNRKNNKLKASLVGYKLGEEVLRVGDLIGRPRGADAKLSYEQAPAKGWFTSHTDIVVEIDKTRKKAFVIGGNVGQSVSKSEVSIDGDGHLNDAEGWFVHIRNNIEFPNVADVGDPTTAQVG